MSRTLGLDLGTNSVGWCLVEDGRKIVATGVRIFPVGVKEDDFRKQGKEVSKNVDRRMARGMRRRRHRYLLRRKRLVELLTTHNMLPVMGAVDSRALYELRRTALDKKIRLDDLGRILLMLNKRRGFKSNRKTSPNEDEKKEEGIVKESISRLREELEESGSRTIGEYFAMLFEAADDEADWHNPQEPVERIRKRFVDRSMYMHEFDMIWNKQARYYPTILTAALRTQIRDRTIYYQRPLKSQKGTVGRCRYEPKKRCAPRSTALFQEFRILQQLAAVRIENGERVGQPLTSEERRILAEFLNVNGKLTEAKTRSLLGFSKVTEFNDVFDIRGNTTNTRLIDALGLDVFMGLDESQHFEIWHLLSYADDPEKLIAIYRRKEDAGLLPSLDDEKLECLSATVLEDGYGNLSTKALTRLLPHLRTGLDLYDAAVAAGYGGVGPGTKKIRELDAVPPLKPNELRNPIVQQILTETFKVVNAIVRAHGKPDMIRVEMARELKKSKTKREEARWESQQKRRQREEYAEFLTKELRRRIYPNDPEVRKYELWLEMGCEDPQLDNVESFVRNGKVRDAVKYRLWKECGRISPYTGKVISLRRLFSAEIEIEHIWPYSKTMNNEFTNLCLCETDVNRRKGDTLPYLFFAQQGDQALEAFKRRVAVFRGVKKQRFLADSIPPDFLPNQLANTSYAAREATYRLEVLLPPVMNDEGTWHPRVQVINGQATATLRRLWGLNPILSNENNPVKNRGDHRHHAIDALVIACTTPRIVQTLSTYSQFDELSRLRNDHIKEPWKSFRDDARDAIMKIIVSLRNDKRLITHKPNLIRVATGHDGVGIVRQSTVSIRGRLHEETLYGRIQHHGREVYVTRQPLTYFSDVKQLEKVVDAKVRDVLLKRVARFGGDVKKAFANLDEDPVYMYTRKKLRVRINKVRIVNPGAHLVLLREETDTWVETGNNYAIAIYEDPDSGKRSFETVPFFEAVRRSLSGTPVIAPKHGGKPLLFSLCQRDIVVRYDVHPDEIRLADIEFMRDRLYRVRKFDVNGTIYFDNLFAAKIDDKLDRKVLYFQSTPGTLTVLPVTVDLLGSVTRRASS